jgi:hypothetical protein
MVVGVGVVVRGSMRVVAVGTVHALYAVGALGMTMTAGLCRVMCVLEYVLREGGRDWRQSVARPLAEMALERRLRWCAYRRLWTSERVCPCVTALSQAIRVELIHLFKVEAAVKCLGCCCLVVVEGAVVQCP